MQDTIHYQTIVAHEDRSRRNVDAQQHRRRRDQRHLERWTDPDRLAMNPSNHSGRGRSATKSIKSWFFIDGKTGTNCNSYQKWQFSIIFWTLHQSLLLHAMNRLALVIHSSYWTNGINSRLLKTSYLHMQKPIYRAISKNYAHMNTKQGQSN